MLAQKIAVTAGKTTHRFRSSVPHSVLGHVELPLGRSAHPRRVAEARHHRLRTHGVAVYPRPNEGTVAELPDVLRKRVGPVGARLDDDVKQKLVTLIAPSLVLDEFRRLGWISRSLHRSDVRVCSLSARPVRFQSGSPAFVTTESTTYRLATANPKADIEQRLRLGTQSRVSDQLMALPKGGQHDGSGPARCRSTSLLDSTERESWRRRGAARQYRLQHTDICRRRSA